MTNPKEIPNKLRVLATKSTPRVWLARLDLLNEAADTIEQQQAELARLQAEGAPSSQEVEDWKRLGEAAALLEDAMRGAAIPLEDGARCVCALQNLATRSLADRTSTGDVQPPLHPADEADLRESKDLPPQGEDTP